MRVKKLGLNALCRKLEKGNGSVAGMKMLLPIGLGKTCLAEVVVKGIDFGHFARGVSVRVEPVHGAGHLCVEVTDLVDDTEEARNVYFRRSEAEQFVRDNKPRRESSDRDWRSCLTGLRAKLDDAKRTRFDKEVLAHLNKEPLTKGSSYQLQKLLPVLAAIWYDLDGEYQIEDAD